MKATAIVNGRVVTFSLSRGLAAAQRRNGGRTLTAAQAIASVEHDRERRATKRTDKEAVVPRTGVTFPVERYTGKRVAEFDGADAELGRHLKRKRK